MAAEFLFKPDERVALPIEGDERLFPVRRVYCVGRNYAEHAREMGHNPNKEKPFFFQKNPDSLVIGRDVFFPYPSMTTNVHHEIELAIALKDGGININVAEAGSKVFGYAIALDMTRRDLQGEAKKAGRPWEASKAFDHAAPITPLTPAAQSGPLNQGHIELKVNGDVRQSGDLNQLIWSISEVISHLSLLFELKRGDIILTGTPAGVGPVQKGDKMVGTIAALGEIKTEVV